jgi:intracellular septation protein
MKSLFQAGKFLFIDMASTLLYVAVFSLTKNIVLSVALGVALGAAEIAWERAQGRRIEAMQWLSLFLVVATGAATFFTKDPRFVLYKPSLIYIIVATVMLKPGWMNRYLPEQAIAIVPDLGVKFGFVWSGLMFATAILNVVVAMKFSLATWAAFMSAWALGSKLGLFLIQYATMRFIAIRRVREGRYVPPADAMPAEA